MTDTHIAFYKVEMAGIHTTFFEAVSTGEFEVTETHTIFYEIENTGTIELLLRLKCQVPKQLSLRVR